MRITISLVGLITILTGPWWLSVLCMTILCLRWAAPEALAIGLLMDLIWTPGTLTSSWHTWPLFTLLAIILLWGLEPLRRRLIL